MKTTVRVTCPTCGGNATLPDNEMAQGWRLCNECMGAGKIDQDPQSSRVDTIPHVPESGMIVPTTGTHPNNPNRYYNTDSDTIIPLGGNKLPTPPPWSVPCE